MVGMVEIRDVFEEMSMKGENSSATLSLKSLSWLESILTLDSRSLVMHHLRRNSNHLAMP